MAEELNTATTAEVSETTAATPVPESNTETAAAAPTHEAAPTSEAPKAEEPAPEADALAGLGEDETAPADEADADKGADVLGAPDGDYSTDGIETPEGVTLAPETMAELGNVCRELNLSQKAFTDIVAKMTPVLERQRAADVARVRAVFDEKLRADPEIGGVNLKATMNAANKAYARFVDQETAALLKASGLNHHPGIIRMFKDINDQISDDAVARGSRPSGKPDPFKALYPNSNMN